jgi:D-alanine-D-alanine ligase
VRRLRIGVIYGGRSGEHEVSLASAASVIANLDRSRYEPVSILIDKDGRWTLPDRPPTPISAADVIARVRSAGGRTGRGNREVQLVPYPADESMLTIERSSVPTTGRENACVTGVALDVIFPVLHGPYGEGGTVRTAGTGEHPYVGRACWLQPWEWTRRSKMVFAARGCPVITWCAASEDGDGGSRGGEPGSRTGVVKPVNLGIERRHHEVRRRVPRPPSTTPLDSSDDCRGRGAEARDLRCRSSATTARKPRSPGEILASRDSTLRPRPRRAATLQIPARLPEADTARIRSLAIQAYQTIDAAGFARVDFLMAAESGDLYVNEINTIPGFTTISMFPKLWGATGLDFPSLLDRLVDLALERHAAKQRLRTSVT